MRFKSFFGLGPNDSKWFGNRIPYRTFAEIGYRILFIFKNENIYRRELKISLKDTSIVKLFCMVIFLDKFFNFIFVYVLCAHLLKTP